MSSGRASLALEAPERDESAAEQDTSKPCVSFHAASLWWEDLHTYKDGAWLNDNAMVFWAEFLSYELFPHRTDYAFMHPSACFLARFLPRDDLVDALAGLDLPTKQIVYIPINDNEDPEAAQAGSHWSMLIWFKREMQFRHYDSAHSPANRKVAEVTAAAIASVIQPNNKGKVAFFHEKTPQQTNGADCGVYAMVIAGATAAQDGIMAPEQLQELVTPKAVADWRRRMRSVVYDMNTVNRLNKAAEEAAKPRAR